MRIKSYFAESVQAAMADARRELGSDALLLKSGKILSTGQPARYEVVFGITESRVTQSAVPHPLQEPPTHPEFVKPLLALAAAEPQSVAPAASATAAPTPIRNSHSRPVSDAIPGIAELRELRRQALRIQGLLAAAAEQRNPPRQHISKLEEVACTLMDQDFEPTVMRSILKSASERMKEDARFPHVPPSEIEAAVRCEVESSFTSINLSNSLEKSGDGSKSTIVLVGPPGSGKTTALTNLAIQYGLAERRNLVFVGFDPIRPGGSEKLETFAAILGVPYSNHSSLAGVQKVINDAPPETLIFVDVPGYSLGDLEGVAEAVYQIRDLGPVELHLVLPASMKSRDLLRYANLYSGFQPRSIIATKIDESQELGGIISACRMLNVPISMAGSGQEMPGSLNPACAKSIIEEIFGTAKRAASVA